MGTVLRHACIAAAAAALAGAALADDSGGDRHRFQFEIDASYVHADSPFAAAWTEGGSSKLRYAETNDGLESTRVFAQYRGRIADTLSATVIADYQSDASVGPRRHRGLHGLAARSRSRKISSRSASARSIRRCRSRTPTSAGRARSRIRTRPSTPGSARKCDRSASSGRCIGGSASRARRTSCARSPRRSMATIPPARCSFGAAGRCTTAKRVSATRCRCRRVRSSISRARWSTTPLSPSSRSTRSITGPAPTRESSGAMRGACSCSSRATTTAPTPMRTRAANGLGARRSITSAFRPACRGSSGSSRSGSKARRTGFKAPAPTARCPHSPSLVCDDFDAKFLMLTRLVRGAHRVSLRYDAFDMHRSRGHARRLCSPTTATPGRSLTATSTRPAGAAASSGCRSTRRATTGRFSMPPTARRSQATETEIRLEMTFRLGATRADAARNDPPRRDATHPQNLWITLWKTA